MNNNIWFHNNQLADKIFDRLKELGYKCRTLDPDKYIKVYSKAYVAQYASDMCIDKCDEQGSLDDLFLTDKYAAHSISPIVVGCETFNFNKEEKTWHSGKYSIGQKQLKSLLSNGLPEKFQVFVPAHSHMEVSEKFKELGLPKYPQEVGVYDAYIIYGQTNYLTYCRNTQFQPDKYPIISLDTIWYSNKREVCGMQVEWHGDVLKGADFQIARSEIERALEVITNYK